MASLGHNDIEDSTVWICVSEWLMLCAENNDIFYNSKFILFRPLLQPSTLPQHATQVRTKIYYNRNSGGPRPVKAAMYRFFRLHNGMWIRVQAKRSRKKWAKSPSHHERLQRHLLCNRQQCQMLDKMATEYYKKPKFYVDDPYEPYHKFSNLPLFRYQKPRYFP